MIQAQSSSGVCSVQHWFSAGAALDPEERSGLAHFLEHLMFAGSAKFGPQVYDKFIERCGGDNNAATWTDWTSYRATVPTTALDELMEMEVDRITNPPKLQEFLSSERGVILEERQQTVENDPDAVAEEIMLKELLPNHPYGRPIIGTREAINLISTNDLAKAHQEYYTASNLTFVLAGGGPREFEIARNRLETLPATSIPKSAPPRLSNLQPGTVVAADVPSTRLHWFGIVPGHDEKQWATFATLGYLLAGSSASLLTNALKIEKQLAHAVHVYPSTGIGTSLWRMEVTLMQDASAQEAIDRVRQNITRIKNGAVNEELILAATMRKRTDFHREWLSLDGAADFLGSRLCHGTTLETMQNLWKVVPSNEELASAASQVLEEWSLFSVVPND